MLRQSLVTSYGRLSIDNVSCHRTRKGAADIYSDATPNGLQVSIALEGLMNSRDL
jgi:phosphoribosylcarboxyaminoimidazole (NCAIR) mutase